jgi:hypothetical protein
MIWLAVLALAIIGLLMLSNLGLQVKLEEARKDAEAWKAIAKSIEDCYIRVPAPTKEYRGGERWH